MTVSSLHPDDDRTIDLDGDPPTSTRTDTRTSTATVSGSTDRTTARQARALVLGESSAEQARVDVLGRTYRRLQRQRERHGARLKAYAATVEVLKPVLARMGEEVAALAAVVPLLSLRLRASLYAAALVIDVLTLHAVMARADFPPLESWTMVLTLTGAMVAVPSLAVHLLLGARSHDEEALLRARRRLSTFFGCIALLALGSLAVGVAVLASLAVNDQLDAPQLVSLALGLVFLGAAVGIPAASACMTGYSYAPGAAKYGRAVRELRRLSRAVHDGPLLVRWSRRRHRALTAELRLRLERAGLRAGLGTLSGAEQALTVAVEDGSDPLALAQAVAQDAPVRRAEHGLQGAARLLDEEDAA